MLIRGPGCCDCYCFTLYNTRYLRIRVRYCVTKVLYTAHVHVEDLKQRKLDKNRKCSFVLLYNRELFFFFFLISPDPESGCILPQHKQTGSEVYLSLHLLCLWNWPWGFTTISFLPELYWTLNPVVEHVFFCCLQGCASAVISQGQGTSFLPGRMLVAGGLLLRGVV